MPRKPRPPAPNDAPTGTPDGAPQDALGGPDEPRTRHRTRAARGTLKAPIAVGRAPTAPADPEPGAGAGLAMPHERDESIGTTAEEPDPVIVQAARDIAEGQVDTDLRTTPGLDAERRAELLRRGGR